MVTFKSKFAVVIFLTFIVFTIVGTLSHEMGHVFVAEALGYDTTLSYGSMDYNGKGYYNDDEVDEMFQIAEKNHEAFNNNQSFKEEQRFLELKRILEDRYPQNEKNDLWIAIGGSLQTILTSIFGLFIIFHRKTKERLRLNLFDWLGIFLGLFILREIFNFMKALLLNFLIEKDFFYGDEFDISRYIGLDQWIVPIITAIIGITITAYIIFKIVPKHYRFSFIISGFIGGLVGYVFWFEFIGPILIP
ncbi:hypothetical protein [Lacinutrix chionoecetis]